MHTTRTTEWKHLTENNITASFATHHGVIANLSFGLQ